MADAGRSRRAHTTADGGAGRCLSDLSDDLLRHILFLAPVSVAAAAAVLSRRWRWLWRTSGAVHIDSRSFVGGCSTPDEERKAFLRGAEEALAAATTHGRIRRLSVSIATNMNVCTFRKDGSEDNLIEALVSIPAARRVEELQIEVKSKTFFTLNFSSLPSEALRVLRLIIACSVLTAAPPRSATASAAFPLLVDLHLHDCCVSLVHLQSIIDASPLLSTFHLASSSFLDVENQVGRLLLPTVSALVVTDSIYGQNLELDVPRLQYFRYKGFVEKTNRLSLKLQASANIHVDLELTHYYFEDPTPARESFWRFIQNFNTAKLLKLRYLYFTMDHLALIDKASQDQLLGGLSFNLLEQLELEAEYKPGDASMAMLANLLHCCPMVRDIRIKLTKQDESPDVESFTVDKQAGMHFDKSVSGFRNRRRRSTVSLGGKNDISYESLDIPGLTGEHSFNCLQSHIKRVSLQFFMDEPNCLGVQLAKFFAKNAMVLQEMHIDDGRQEMLEHVNSIVQRRRIANTDNCNIQLK